MRTLSRRDLLRRGAAVGGSLALPAVVAGRAAAAPPVVRRPAQRFYADPGINFQILLAFGSIAYGCAELGELTTITNRINRRGATYDAVYDEFSSYAARLRARGEDALARGRTVTARACFLRAAQYENQALFFVLGTRGPGREKATYLRMDDSFTRAAGLFSPAFERVEIPYEGATMPGWLLKPHPSSEPRPTIVVNNGSDGQLVDVYAWGGAAAVERGWNALLFEGPGQGSMLFVRGIPFRPDWEAVVTPIVDYLLTRPDVAPDRIAISGWSMAGELVGRAAAFEHRLAAVVLDPGVTDVIAAWRLPRELIDLVNAGRRKEVDEGWAEFLEHATPVQRFEVAKRSEIFRAPDVYTLIEDLQRYRNADVLSQIASPTLVVDYQFEQFYPGQARRAYDLITAPKAYIELGVPQGAQYHCAPMAPQRRNEEIYGWLEETLGL